ncbi:sigma-70 family RNA polymerase sigma factor [Streptosporangium sp. NPDC006930]|uniref:sigma-70 family RNA polymerase sigma factor n=1 Tax=Streptosporangium sp. NPDC006930 TaxID=3154783 RepID=UPI003412C5BF
MRIQPNGVAEARSTTPVAASTGNTRVDSALRLAQRFVQGKALPAAGWKRIIQATQLNEPEARLLFKAAASFGLEVSGTPASDVQQETGISKHRDVSSPPAYAHGKSAEGTARSTAISLEHLGSASHIASSLEQLTPAVAAAMKVIEDDRRTKRPWKRVLTAEEEVGLAQLMRQDSPLDVELPEDFPSGFEDDSLPRKAWDCMMLHNIGLVHAAAHKNLLPEGMEHDDLAHYGIFGIARAIQKFDASMGVKFSTYATWWAKQSMSRAIADFGSLIRIPVHMHETCQKIRSIQRSLYERGLPAGPADIALIADLTPSKVQEAMKISRVTASLDIIIGDGSSLGDFLATTDHFPSTESIVLAKLENKWLRSLLKQLPERSAEIVALRHGLYDDDEWTLERVGARFGFTRERARQIELQAMKQLRSLISGERPARQNKEVVAEFPQQVPVGAKKVSSGRPMKQWNKRGARPRPTPQPTKEMDAKKDKTPSQAVDSILQERFVLVANKEIEVSLLSHMAKKVAYEMVQYAVDRSIILQVAAGEEYKITASVQHGTKKTRLWAINLGVDGMEHLPPRLSLEGRSNKLLISRESLAMYRETMNNLTFYNTEGGPTFPTSIPLEEIARQIDAVPVIQESIDLVLEAMNLRLGKELLKRDGYHARPSSVTLASTPVQGVLF